MAANSSKELHVKAGGPAHDMELELDYDNTGLTVVVPWKLPEDLDNGTSEAKDKIEEIFNNKLQELLKDKPVRIKLDSFEPADEPDKTEIFFRAFDASQTKENVPVPIEDLLYYTGSLNATNITVKGGVIYWDGPDLCASKQPLCSHNSLCINTLGSYSCVCQHGYYDVSSVTERAPASHPVCQEKGLFSRCLDKLMAGAIAKPYLHSRMGGAVAVKLNDGRCIVNESETLYYFRTSRKVSECGTEKQVNKTHINFQNTLSVTLTKGQMISRRDLKVVWKCVYPRHYVRNAQVSVDMEWLTSMTLVEFNSSVHLGLKMTLYRDESYTNSYRDAITLELEDTLFFQVALETNSSFAVDLLLQVKSCWTTESIDPHDPTQGVLLQDGCPVDPTFHWLSVNGLAHRSRFSIQMFNMPKKLPLYFHCLASICGHDEDCRLKCTGKQHTKRSVSQMESEGKHAAVVSAGPLIVNTRVKSATPSYWAEYMTVIAIVAGSIGFLGVTVLLVSATKAIMTYYEQLRSQ
uniref:ZP domain-containing protein n=2 Tax=Astatotilapia calliptera TaxID=8154 RepID=A0A3P8Q0M8_ASTCA